VAGLIAGERAAALDAALADLPERQRQAVVLRHLEGLSNPEIAAVMDVGVEAVESLTARGKRALTARLAGRRADLGYEDEPG
jgi:RNA polymerase sigma-70 factor (ECF subfamily)